MIEEMIGSYGNRLLLAAAGVGAALVLLAGILWLMRKRGASSPFIRGGKNRQPRLQVLDAAAIDTRRRLVLVRRDNVEHLVMIGGPTDIVIESGIATGAATETSLLAVKEPSIPALAADSQAAIPATRRPPALAAPVASLSPEPAAQITPAPATMTAAAPVTPDPKPDAAAPAAPEPEARPRPVAPPVRPAPAAAATTPPPVDPPVTRTPPAFQTRSGESDLQKEARSEFERILEAEIASRPPASAQEVRPDTGRPNLQQRREPVVPPAPPPPVVAARQIPASPPASETVPDADVQREIARIFGEMSVTRDR